MTESMIERFWSYVKKGSKHDCWLWAGAKSPNNRGMYYGTFRLNGKMVKAHRASLILSGVKIPPLAVIRHTCDNGLCVNPDHLIPGTQKENVADRYNRGRSFHHRGETHGNSKLSELAVLDIRRAAASGEKQASIAARHGISRYGVYYALRGWSHVD